MTVGITPAARMESFVMEELATCYKILGVSPESSLLEVNQAYSNLLNAIRIDRTSGDPERQRLAQVKAEEVNEAYAEIKKVLTMYREIQASFRGHEPLARPRDAAPRLSPPGRRAAVQTGNEAASARRAAPTPIPPDDYALAAKAAAVDKAAEVIAAAVEAAAVKTAAARASVERAEAARTAAVKAAAARALAEKAAAEKADAIFRNLARLAVCLMVVALAAAAFLFVTKVILPPRAARLKAEREAAAEGRRVAEKQAVLRSKPARRDPDRSNANVQNEVKSPAEAIAPAPDAAQDAEQVARQARDHAVRLAASLRPAAEQGDADAENRLGTLYAAGTGVPQDYREAVKWYRKAAEQGHAEAQKNLAELLAQGKGTSKDFREAVRWLRRSAGQGNKDAQRALDIWAER